MQKQEYETKLVPLDKIRPSFFQTRIETMDENLGELVESIEKYGVLQPIVLRSIDKDYEVIAGDRRVRAARKAGLSMIPASIRDDLSDEDALFLQATENLQRQGLSDGEKSRIVNALAKRCKLDGRQLADRLKKSYEWVMMYLDSEFKDQVKAAAGSWDRNGKKSVVTDYNTECEFCTVSTSEPKE